MDCPLSRTWLHDFLSAGYPVITYRADSLEFLAGCRTVSNNGSGSGLATAQNTLAVQVWFGFT